MKKSCRNEEMDKYINEMPQLTGIFKQIKWATAIRFQLYLSNPDDGRLQKHTIAKYWIDARKII